MNKRIIDMVKYAYTNVPFYRKLAKDNNIDVKNLDETDFENLPLVQKNDIVEQPKELLSDQYLLFPKKNHILLRSTSGSTGKYLKIYWDEYEAVQSMVPLWVARQRYYHIKPSDKYCFFFNNVENGNHLVEEGNIAYSENDTYIGFSKNGLTKERLLEIYYKMYEFKPKWLMMMPSVGALLCECIKENKLLPINSIEYIEFTGEMLLDSFRKEVEELFQCKVSNQYGCNEADSIAFECPCGHMHMMTSNEYVEIIEDGKCVSDGVEGDIYITTLYNHAMPFIRYCIGDRGRIVTDIECPCGNKRSILEVTKGRKNDYILMKDGRKINAFVFVRTIEFLNARMGNIIKQFQIIQNDYGVFTVRLAVLKQCINWKDVIKEEFINFLKEPDLKNAEYKLELSDALFPDDKNGKLLFFKNELIQKEEEYNG